MSLSSFLKSFFPAAVGAALLVGQAGTPADAALLVYDPFTTGAGPADYAAGDEVAGTNVLGGQNPATGPAPFYSGAWKQSGGDAQAVKDIGSLAYPLFPQAGGQIQETLQFSCCTYGRSGREIAGGLGGGGARTLYQSFLIDFGTQGTDAPTDFGLRAYEMWNGDVGDSFLAVQLFVNHFAGISELTLQVTTASGTQSELVNGGGLTLEALEGVHLVVLRFDFDPANPDSVTLYLDPTDSVEGNYTPAAAIDVAASDLIITHHSAMSNFTFSGAGHVPGAFDELRWGDTFADVTPFLDPQVAVPAPPALALFAVGALGLMATRRRRR